jgi:hypothetical protein
MHRNDKKCQNGQKYGKKLREKVLFKASSVEKKNWHSNNIDDNNNNNDNNKNSILIISR